MRVYKQTLGTSRRLTFEIDADRGRCPPGDVGVGENPAPFPVNQETCAARGALVLLAKCVFHGGGYFDRVIVRYLNRIWGGQSGWGQ